MPGALLGPVPVARAIARRPGIVGLVVQLDDVEECRVVEVPLGEATCDRPVMVLGPPRPGLVDPVLEGVVKDGDEAQTAAEKPGK